MTASYSGSTMSGFPGSSRTCRRNRKPRWCRALRTKISGLVFRPRMPAIIRLRVAVSTMSATDSGEKQRGLGDSCTFLFDQGLNVRDHDARNFPHDRHHNAIAELAISLRVTYGNPERVRESH